ncbi:BrnA antitoxin family protein [Persicimonas caeni]|nr:BrnA antitoxin family protein [Persicimonas caeni]
MSSGNESNPPEEYREVPEDRETLGRGPDALRKRLQQAAKRKQQLTIRLDADIVERFKQLAGPDGSYQTLINRALHEWLEAQSVGGLLRTELEELRALVQALKPEGDSPVPPA